MPPTRTELTIAFVPELLAREGAVWVSAASSSMGPLIRPGDALRLVRLAGARVRPGALVAVRHGGTLVVHRVVRSDLRHVVTKGDALSVMDPPVELSRVVARVAAIRTPTGRLLDLDRFPWPVIGRALGALAGLHASSGIAWIALRAPFHLAARLLR